MMANLMRFLVLLGSLISVAKNAKVISKLAGLTFPKSDCSNTLDLEKTKAQNLIPLSSVLELPQVADVVWLDNETEKKKRRSQVSTKYTIPACNAGKESGKKKKYTKLELLRQRCTAQPSSGTPWHVLLYRTDENMVFCQGVLIDTNWVLTVAHCLVGHDSGILKADVIRVMVKGLSENLKVTKVYTHESFKYATFTHDVALLRIQPPSKAVVPICLPNKAISSTQSPMEVWWEGDAFDVSFPGDFFEGKARLLNLQDCKRKIVQSAISYSFDQSQVCSESPDYCSGDMWQRMSVASPLFVKEGSSALLMGLKSWGSSSFSCEAGSESQVHIDVFKYLNWISGKLDL